jgi:phage tail-like protein
MASTRTVPYGAFNYLVTIGNEDFGGFSDVSGIGSEIKVAEYRNGNESTNYVHKVPGIHTAGDVTLKRGIVDSAKLWAWIGAARVNDSDNTKRDVNITLRDEAQKSVQIWKLRNAMPMKYTGPTLAGKGGGDVAMEEIVLSVEDLEILPSTA